MNEPNPLYAECARLRSQITEENRLHILDLARMSDQATKLREDAARLDFIANRHATIYASNQSRGAGVLYWVFVDEAVSQSDRRGVLGKTLRNAIDRARKVPA